MKFLLALRMARRLTLAPGSRKSSPGVKVATAAVALSISVMIAAVAIVLGFKREITSKVTGFNPHITLSSVDPHTNTANILTLTPSLGELLRGVDGVNSVELAAAAPAILKTPDDFKGIYVKSLSEGSLREILSSSLDEGRMPDYSKDPYETLLSRKTARQLGLKAGDRIDTYFITDNVRVRKLKIVGIFNSHFEAYDDAYVYTSLPVIQDIGGLHANEGTTVNLSLTEPERVQEVTTRVATSLQKAAAEGLIYRSYNVDNVLSTGANYFRWLDLLDMNVAVVLTLMIIVASVTLISGMLIIMVDNKRFIAIMKCLGASNSLLRGIFINLAVRVALTGLLIGDSVTIALLYIQRATHVIPLDPEAYYIDFVPVDISWWAILTLNAGVVITIYLVLILPARFVGSVSPATVLNRE